MRDITPVGEELLAADALVERISELIDQARQVIAAQANAVLTLTNWSIGNLIETEVLQKQRADYGSQIVAIVAQQLTVKYGRGYDRSNLTRMAKFSRLFPEETVASLAPQLSWTHFREILPLASDEARGFYVRQAVALRLSVRELRQAISRKAFERREIADSQIAEGSAVPHDTFNDPMFLDMLELHDGYLEKDLEAAILHDMRAFLMEVGQGFTFVDSQKRMTIGDDEHYLDLLFYSRPLRRLVAVELKLGKFHASFEGQMRLYLKWLNRYERQPHEEAPFGLILCSEANREEVELLEMHKDGIAVVEYWTALPSKAELEARLRQIVRDAKERLARHALNAPMMK